MEQSHVRAKPHIDNQRLDLLLNAIDPEAVPPPQGKRR